MKKVMHLVFLFFLVVISAFPEGESETRAFYLTAGYGFNVSDSDLELNHPFYEPYLDSSSILWSVSKPGSGIHLGFGYRASKRVSVELIWDSISSRYMNMVAIHKISGFLDNEIDKIGVDNVVKHKSSAEVLSFIADYRFYNSDTFNFSFFGGPSMIIANSNLKIDLDAYRAEVLTENHRESCLGFNLGLKGILLVSENLGLFIKFSYYYFREGYESGYFDIFSKVKCTLNRAILGIQFFL